MGLIAISSMTTLEQPDPDASELGSLATRRCYICICI